jgi:tetratricopeptide (TPR) repeat protein
MKKLALFSLIIGIVLMSSNLFSQDNSKVVMKENSGVKMQQIDENLSYDELQSKVIDYYRKDSIDTAIFYMEYAQNKFPEKDMQSLKTLGKLYTIAGQYSKAITIWKQGFEKGFFYDLNNESYQKYYKDNPDFTKLAKIEKDKIDASHILYEVLLPKNYDKNRLYPTLFIFHGNNRNIELSKSVWISEIMKEKFISVFVQSYINMGEDTFQWVPKDEKTNKEFKEIYDNIMSTYSVDTNKIIFSGMSAGGSKVVEYAFNEFVPMSGLVLNCPVIPTDITEEAVKEFVEKNKRIGIITGEKDFALVGQKKLVSDIENLNGKTKMIVNKGLGHVFSEDFSIKLDEYLKWVIE